MDQQLLGPVKFFLTVVTLCTFLRNYLINYSFYHSTSRNSKLVPLVNFLYSFYLLIVKCAQCTLSSKLRDTIFKYTSARFARFFGVRQNDSREQKQKLILSMFNSSHSSHATFEQGEASSHVSLLSAGTTPEGWIFIGLDVLPSDI